MKRKSKNKAHVVHVDSIIVPAGRVHVRQHRGKAVFAISNKDQSAQLAINFCGAFFGRKNAFLRVRRDTPSDKIKKPKSDISKDLMIKDNSDQSPFELSLSSSSSNEMRYITSEGIGHGHLTQMSLLPSSIGQLNPYQFIPECEPFILFVPYLSPFDSMQHFLGSYQLSL